MIQRFSVHFEDPQNIDGAMERLESIGFAEEAIRVWREEITGDISMYACRDEEVDQMKPIDPQRMDDYCDRIWKHIGFARITLTEFRPNSETIEIGRDEYSKWSSNSARPDCPAAPW